MAAASRQLLLRGRGFLAGRRVATSPTQAPRAFSTTTATSGGSHVPQPQSHWQSYQRVVEEYTRVKKRHLQVSMAAVFVGVSGLVGTFTKPSPSFKSLIREEMSKAEMSGSSSSRHVAPIADSGVSGLLGIFTTPSPSFKSLIREEMSKTEMAGSSSRHVAPIADSGVPGLLGVFTRPSPSFKSLIREGMSKTETSGSSSSRPVAHVASSAQTE